MARLYAWVCNTMRGWFKSENGADMVEYAMLVSLVVVVAIVAVATLGHDVAAMYSGLDGAF
jgi:Flp pilus assembly pilin Flp